MEVIPHVGHTLEYFWEFIPDSKFSLLNNQLGWEDGDQLRVVHLGENDDGELCAMVANVETDVLNTAIITDPAFFIKPLTEMEQAKKDLKAEVAKLVNTVYGPDEVTDALYDYILITYPEGLPNDD